MCRNFGRIDLTIDIIHIHARIRVYQSFYRNSTSCKLRQKIAVTRSLSDEASALYMYGSTDVNVRTCRTRSRESSQSERGATTEAVALGHYSRHIKHLLCLTLHLPQAFVRFQNSMYRANACHSKSHRIPI